MSSFEAKKFSKYVTLGKIRVFLSYFNLSLSMYLIKSLYAKGIFDNFRVVIKKEKGRF